MFFPHQHVLSCWWWKVIGGAFWIVSLWIFSSSPWKFFSFYLETKYFVEFSPCGFSPSACFILLMVKIPWWDFLDSFTLNLFCVHPEIIFSLCLETKYFVECSPCVFSPSACFILLVVKIPWWSILNSFTLNLFCVHPEMWYFLLDIHFPSTAYFFFSVPRDWLFWWIFEVLYFTFSMFICAVD